MKQVKSYLNIETMKGKMYSLVESAKKRKRTTFALLAAFVMIGSVGVYVTYMHSNVYHSGIPVNISVKFSGAPPGLTPFVNGSENNNTYYNNQNVFFSLISDVPMGLNLTPEGKFVNMGGMNTTNNPYVISVMSGRESSKGTFSSYLGTNLFNIARQWRASGISNQSQVSVMLQAEYSLILNGKIYEYRYYNNIPYSPFNTVFNDMQTFKTSTNTPSISLDSQIFFNLSHPAYVGTFNISDLHNKRILHTPPAGIIGGHGTTNPCTIDCLPSDYCSPSYNGIAQPLAEKSWTGILPLAIATMQLPSSSQFEASITATTVTSDMHFNTAEACQPDSSTTQVMDSTSGSFNTGNITSLSSITGAQNTAGANQSISYLPNVTFSATEFHNVYPEKIFVNGKWYCGVYYGTPYTIMKVDAATSTQVNSAPFYDLANDGNKTTTSSIWGAVINSLGMRSVQTQQLNAGHTQSTFSYSSYVKEYNNAKSEMATINNAMGTFSAALGVALAINAATGIIPGGATADDVVNGIALSAAEVGLSSAIISDMSSISIQVSSSTHFNNFILANQVIGTSSGTNLQYTIFQSAGSTPIFFTNNGNTYNFNTPMDYFSVVPIS
ncbi:MAG: hypothetical protein ACYDBI_09660 [Thermoplasmataceae archaeon]